MVVPKMATAFFGGGEEYVPCFSKTQRTPTSSVLMFTFLVLGVIILMNMVSIVVSGKYLVVSSK